MSIGTPILSARGLSARRSWRTVFADVNIDVLPGDRIYITGQNGSGKTTLLETLLGLHTTFSGELRWRGKLGSPKKWRTFQKHEVFYLPQRDNLFSSLTLRQNIFVGAQTDHGLAKGKLEDALNTVPELQSSLDKRPSEASAGQRQIAAFLRLLIRRPLLVILDEPTAGVNETLLLPLYKLFTQLLAPQSGMLFTDQHTVVARSFATQELLLENGRLGPIVDKPQLSGE